MRKSKYILDTNILIRFLTSDPENQAKAIETFFLKAPKKSLIVPDVVIVETVFFLLSFYELPKNDVIEKITALIHFEKFDLHVSLFQKTLELYSKYSISFVDAYVGAMSINKSGYIVCTFDKKLLNISSVKAVKP